MADKWHEAMCRLLLSEIPSKNFPIWVAANQMQRETFMNCRHTAHHEHTLRNLTNATLSKCTHTHTK